MANNRFIPHTIVWLLAMTVGSLTLQAQKITLMLQWMPQAQFAGYYIAKEKGFYRDAKIDVTIEHPNVSQSTMTLLKENNIQATTLQLCQALEYIDQGIDLVNVLQTSMNNAMVIVSAHNENPLTQKGKRVGIWNTGFSQVAICMSNKEKLNYKWVKCASNINLFISGALDAIATMSYNEYQQIRQTGMTLNEKNTYWLCDHGYNIQGDGLYVSRQFYYKNLDLVQRFALASKKGWEWAARHPEEAIDIVMKIIEKEHIATNRTMQKLMLQEVLRLQVDRDSKRREFRLRPEMVKKASSLLKENNLLSREISYDELIAR